MRHLAFEAPLAVLLGTALAASTGCELRGAVPLDAYQVTCSLELVSEFDGNLSFEGTSACIGALDPAEADREADRICRRDCQSFEGEPEVESCTVLSAFAFENGCDGAFTDADAEPGISTNRSEEPSAAGEGDTGAHGASVTAASSPSTLISGYEARFATEGGPPPGRVRLQIRRSAVDLPFAGGVAFSIDGCPGSSCRLRLDDFLFLLTRDVEVRGRTLFGGVSAPTRIEQARPAEADAFDPASGRFSFAAQALTIYAHWSRDRVRPGRVHESVALTNDSPLEGALDLSSSPPTLAFAGRFTGPDSSVTLEVTGKVSEQPPVAVLAAPSEVECDVVNPDDRGTFVDLDASGSSDPDGDLLGYSWTVDGEPRTSTVPEISDFLGLGGHSVTLTAFDRRLARSETVRAAFEVRDTQPPTGSITVPAECECFGPDALPVEVLDSFRDRCTSELAREYAPSAGPFSAHGDHRVAVTARDAGGRSVADVRSFTIDLVAPQLEIGSPEPRLYSQVTELPIPLDFLAVDADGAAGGVVHEQVFLDGEVLFDGAGFGDADGRLSDEVSPSRPGCLVVGLDALCRSAGGVNGRHVLTLSASDCGGNTTTRSVPFSVLVPPDACRAAVPRDLVVNEVDYDQGADDAFEFVELKNVGTSPVDLADYALRTYYYGPLESQPRHARYERYRMEPVTLEPGGYFVVCTEENPAGYCDQRVTPTGWGRLPAELLRETSPSTATLVYNTTDNPFLDRVVDSLCYIGSETPGDPGAGVPGALAGGRLTEGKCNSQIETEAETGVSRVPDGRDSDDNQRDLRQACLSPGEENFASVSCQVEGGRLGRLRLNELDVNQPEHPDRGEFVEIYNAGGDGVFLGDYQLVHRFFDPFQSFFPVEERVRLPAVTLAAGAYYVSCREGRPAYCRDGGLFPLGDTNGVVAIVHNVTGLPEHDALVDSVAYGSPGPASQGGPSSGGRWIEGLPVAAADGEHSVDGVPEIGFSRRCQAADTDCNASDFALAPVTPGAVNADPR